MRTFGYIFIYSEQFSNGVADVPAAVPRRFPEVAIHLSGYFVYQRPRHIIKDLAGIDTFRPGYCGFELPVTDAGKLETYHAYNFIGIVLPLLRIDLSKLLP